VEGCWVLDVPGDESGQASRGSTLRVIF